MKSVFKQLSTLSMGVLALIAGLHSAHAAPLATANASLSNLKITLVDLAPNDGIAPSVSFGSGFLTIFGDQATNESGYSVAHTGALFGSTASGSSGGLSYDVSPTSIVLGASADSSHFGQAALSEYGDSYYNTGTSNGLSLLSASPDDIDNYYQVGQFTLSANTGLFITGTASTSATTASQADVRAAATGSFDATTADLSQLNGSAYASASISIVLTSTEVLTPQGYNYGVPNTIVSNVRRGVDVYGEEAATFEDSSPFVLSFANASSESVDGALSLNVQVGVNTYAIAPALFQPEVPAIPEPSTYLLMGLGLAGIGRLACSRQRAKQATAQA